MATFNRTSKRGAGAVSAAQGTGGVEPVGRVRRSQLITTYGIGAIVDLEKGSYMPMGLEDWERVTRLPSLSIGEDRLQVLLGVDHFRLAPIAVELKPTRQVDPEHAVPVVRFPDGTNARSAFELARRAPHSSWQPTAVNSNAERTPSPF